MSAGSQGQREMGAQEARVYALVERAVVEGKRCPTNAEIAADLNKSGLTKPIAATSVPGVFRQLIRRGMVTVRVYGNNWRDVVILQGTNAGKATLPPPHGGKPHIVLDPDERARRDKATR